MKTISMLSWPTLAQFSVPPINPENRKPKSCLFSDRDLTKKGALPKIGSKSSWKAS